MDSNLTAIDLYAGAGLFSYAFQKEGFRIVQAVEIDKFAAQTYVSNLGAHLEENDVRRTRPKQKADIIIAGPPCQGFSTLGRRDANDPRNKLSLEILKWLDADPSVIIIENVPAFLKSPTWEELAKELQCKQFDVEAVVLNAYDFGVPQLRKRSFTIASKVGIPAISTVTKQPIKTVREAWKGLADIPDGNNHHYSPTPSELALSRMSVIPARGDKRDVLNNAPELAPPSWFRLKAQATDVWGRMDWDAPSNTMRTALLNPSKGRYIHPEQNRVVSLREAARLHSISDEWVFSGPPTRVAMQIGNSVPPMLGRAVARGISQLF